LTDEEVDEAVLDAVVRFALETRPEEIPSGEGRLTIEGPIFSRVVWRAGFRAGEEAARASYRTGLLETLVKTDETLQ